MVVGTVSVGDGVGLSYRGSRGVRARGGIDDVVVKSFPVYSGYLSDLKTVFERENTA